MDKIKYFTLLCVIYTNIIWFEVTETVKKFWSKHVVDMDPYEN